MRTVKAEKVTAGIFVFEESARVTVDFLTASEQSPADLSFVLVIPIRSPTLMCAAVSEVDITIVAELLVN